jgi:very-short-patch-repair endonuclease
MDGAEERCLQLAARQRGVIRRDQLASCGFSVQRLQRRVFSRSWIRVYPGVYRIAGSPDDWKQQLKALALWLGNGVLSHHTAATLHGFSQFSPGRLEATVTHGTRAPTGVIVHRVPAIAARDITTVEGLAVTSIARTLLDLAATLEPPFVRSCCDEALRRKWTNLDKLDATVERNLRRPGLTQLRALTHELRGGNGPTESELEHRVRELLRDGGFSEPDRQKAIRTRERLRRVDFIFSAARVVIEADGYASHSGITSFEDDRRRNNALMARGFIVLHWTWKALHEEPGRLLVDLAVCLRRAL